MYRNQSTLFSPVFHKFTSSWGNFFFHGISDNILQDSVPGSPWVNILYPQLPLNHSLFPSGGLADQFLYYLSNAYCVPGPEQVAGNTSVSQSHPSLGGTCRPRDSHALLPESDWA